ncbi:PilX N-terminal domain-containing pilus assembly protein [Shewanella intestini]|uniref:Pilus assembly protein PilX n=1 Tax=Shewanella intestini TaxID=2017544 RepID=A0ABS5I889_9GAMM|nr:MULTISPECIES: pilus assembly PilX N-terminal domain-containing protein [Shewanella]MBR9729535.1 pilus assembly protein PilX [Shewanella intestini]MRG37524.1 pilus assembly protein PilX [Shewanella sp. XMDDZSB0408]
MTLSVKKQQGIVLFFSLITLILMTIIGVALAVNATQSLRMAGAGAERVSAKSTAIGAQHQVLNDTQGDVMANIVAPIHINNSALNVSSTITPMTNNDVNCQRSSKAYSAASVSCRRAEVESTITFGRSDYGRLTVVSGVEQEVFTGS